MSRYGSVARLAGDRRRSRAGRFGSRPPELVYRSTRPLVRTVQLPAPRIIQNTVHQTVVHLHQTTRQHVLNRLSAAGDGRGGATLAIQPADGGAMDGSRPALTARRMLRILSTESARRTLWPFYQELFQELLNREREKYRGRPEKSLLLVQSILDRHQMLTSLRRLYRPPANKPDGARVHMLVCQRYVRHIRQDGEADYFHRYASRQRMTPEDLRQLPAARRSPPLPHPHPHDRERSREPGERRTQAPPVPASGLRLSDADFQLLVRGVAGALGRQSRLEALRRGGM